MDIYKLYRDFWDYAFENPEVIKPNHIAIYSFAIEHCNRLGWKKKYGLPSTMVMEATGIKSYNTYIDAFNKLVEIGFIELIEKSKNQYSSNIIALSNFNKAHHKALDKALTKHTTKQSESTLQSNDSINKQDYNNTSLQNKNIHTSFAHLKITHDEYKKLIDEGFKEVEIKDIFLKIENYKKNTKYKSLYLTALNWLKDKREREKTQTPERTIKDYL